MVLIISPVKIIYPPLMILYFTTSFLFKTHCVPSTHSSPWLTVEICQLKAKSCHLECRYAKTRLVAYDSPILHFRAKSFFYANLTRSVEGNTRT